MPRGVPNTTDPTPAAVVMTATDEAPPVKLVPVKLLRNYRPLACEDETIVGGRNPKTGLPIETVRAKAFPADRVVGYNKPAVMRKNAAGQMVEIEPAAFIKDTVAPPKTPGTGFRDKILAGTVIRLPVDEAKAVRKAGIGEYELDD